MLDLHVDFKVYLNLEPMQLLRIEKFLTHAINRPFPPRTVKVIKGLGVRRQGSCGSTSYSLVPEARALDPGHS